VVNKLLLWPALFLLFIPIAFSLTIIPIYPKNNTAISEDSTWFNISTNRYADCSYSLDSNSFDGFSSSTADNWKVKTSTKILDLGEDVISGTNRETIRNITTFIDDSELNGLANGQVTNSKNASSYYQFLYTSGLGIGLSSSYVFYTKDLSNITADFLYYKSGAEIGRYLLELLTPLQSDIYNSAGAISTTGLHLTDFENMDITFFGKSYKIIQARRTSSAGNNIELIFMSNAVNNTLLEGNTNTYTILDKKYNVTLDFVDAIRVKFTVNAQTTSLLNKSQFYILSDNTSIYVSDILYQDFAGGIHSATFYLGRDKTELQDANIKDVDSTNFLIVNNNTIDNAHVIIEGTDNNNTFKINRIHVNMTAEDDFYVPAGKRLSENPDMNEPEVLFTSNWDILYKGLGISDTEKIKLEISGSSKYVLRFNDWGGQQVSVPIANSPGGGNLSFGETNKDFINVEAYNISKDDYLVVTNGTTNRSARPTYVLQYKGADKLAVDNRVLKFRDLGSGVTIEVPYNNSVPLASLTLNGTKNDIYLATSADINQNDFNIRMDLDGDGILNNNTNSNVVITTRYGAEINMTNHSGVGNTIQLSIRTPDNQKDAGAKDNVDTLYPTVFMINITANSGIVNHTRYGNLNFRTPSNESNVEYAYTSYGTYIKREFPAGLPATLDIDYPRNQTEALVYYENGGMHSKLLSNISEGQHNVQINCSDIFNAVNNYYFLFNFTTLPNVTSYYPTNRSVNVSVKTNIVINFSEGIDKSTLKENNIVVKELNDGKLKGMFTYNATINKTIFDPVQHLKYNTTYIVNVTTNVKDIAGNSLDRDYVWNFTTALKDTDNDGTPDYDDDDNDNDGIDDNSDFLRGNLSNINSDFVNLSMKIDEDENISKIFNGTKKIKFYNGEKKLLEFNFNFSNNSMLDFTNISILNASNSTLGGIVISGINLPGSDFTKTAYMEKVDAGINGICIKDEEIEWIDNITASCSGVNEFKVECDGSSQNGYICTYNSSSNLYAITGLKHSGAKQLAYTKPSSDDSSSNNGGSSGGGGSGGGGGGGGGGGLGVFYICNMDWSCTSWSECENGWETRECSFVKVPQHTTNESCATIDNIPQRAKKCNAIGAAEKQENKTIEGIMNKTAKDKSDKSGIGITGAAVKDIEKVNMSIGIPIIIIIVLVGTLIYLFFKKK